MMVAVFVVGGFLVYRMISSVQKQLLLVKQEVSNMKNDIQNVALPTSNNSVGDRPGFEVHFDQQEDDDSVSVDSIDIDKIMRKLSAREDGSEHDSKSFLSALKEEHEESVKGAKACSELVGNEPPSTPTKSEESPAESPQHENSDSTDRVVEIAEDLHKKSLADLKKMVKERGLSVKGNKAQLVEALQKESL